MVRAQIRQETIWFVRQQPYGFVGKNAPKPYGFIGKSAPKPYGLGPKVIVLQEKTIWFFQHEPYGFVAKSASKPYGLGPILRPPRVFRTPAFRSHVPEHELPLPHAAHPGGCADSSKYRSTRKRTDAGGGGVPARTHLRDDSVILI
jgi:hypothetical protein